MSWNDDWPKDQDDWPKDSPTWADGNGGWDGAPRRRSKLPYFVGLLALIVVAGLLLLIVRNRGRQATAATPVATADATAAVVTAAATTALAGNQADPTATSEAAPTTDGAAPTAATTPANQPPAGDIQTFPFEDPLYTLAMDLINESRREAGLPTVVWAGSRMLSRWPGLSIRPAWAWRTTACQSSGGRMEARAWRFSRTALAPPARL